MADSSKPKPGTKADLQAKLNAAIRINSYLATLSRTGLAAKLGQTFDGDRDLYATLGYPVNPDFDTFLGIYLRDGLGTRVVDTVADETWRAHPILLESEKQQADEDDEPGPIQKKFLELASKHDLWAQFNEVDRSLGISRFGLLYLGLPGDPEQPAKKSKSLAYVSVHDEGTAQIEETSIDRDPASERFGMPEFYQIAIDDQTNQMIQVHYSRVIHVKEGRERKGLGRVYGVPRILKVLNRLLDLEKVLGGGSEAFWLLIYRGMALQAKEGYTLPSEGTDEYKKMQEEIDEYMHGLRRYMRLQGMEVEDLGGSPVDSREQFDVLIEYIAGSMRIPQRVLLGSERGNLASSQDDANFMDYIDWRRKNFAEPYILRPFLNRCDELGILDLPDGYHLDWPSLFQLTDLEEADMAGKIAQAMSSASGGAPETIMPPEEFAKRLPGKWNFVWTPKMLKEQAEEEEQARQDQQDQFGQGGFGGNGDGGQGSPFGKNGNGQGQPAELDLSRFRRVLNYKPGGMDLDPLAYKLRTAGGMVIIHNEHEHSAMVALRVPERLRSELQQAYPFMSDETRDELHITLAYLGDTRSLDMERAAWAVAEFAQIAKPIKTKLQGVARFVSGGEQDAIVATVDSPDFPRLRESLCSLLDARGVPYAKDHGFIPHVTLAYIPADAQMPVQTVEPLELNFYEVFLVDGGEWYGIKFGEPMPVDAMAPVQYSASTTSTPGEAGEGGGASPIPFDRIRAGLQAHHDGPGPHASGSPQSVHGSPGSGSASRVWAGKAHQGDSELSKLEVGEIGESLAERALEDALGADFATLNVGINNSPIDLAGDHTAVEVKAGLATNGRTAQQWRATIGGMSPAERALYSKMGKAEKKAWNARKNELILERKHSLLEQMSKEAGAKIRPMTVGVILSPDGKRGDVYAVPGFHLRLGWNQYATDQYYLGTYDVN